MKKMKNLIRYYIAGSLTGIIGGIILIALGSYFIDWYLTTGGWIVIFLGVAICGPGVVFWYWKEIDESQPAIRESKSTTT